MRRAEESSKKHCCWSNWDLTAGGGKAPEAQKDGSGSGATQTTRLTVDADVNLKKTRFRTVPVIW